ncbi:MAG: nucleoside-diphosphate sugar epimerase/dehydratase, partial [Oscillospiraceae bacterium]|nr:nucleoside-diphosphate sugar epimerase/dehydratase [Oscillospiraceae bacterium]
FLCGVYCSAWRFERVNGLMKCVLGTTVGFGAFFAFHSIFKTPISDVYNFANYVASTFGIVAVRIIYGYLYVVLKPYFISKNAGATLIVGAGCAGRMLLEDLQRSKDEVYYPIYFVDDDQEKINKTTCGVKVYGTTLLIPEICKKLKIKNIWLAIPSASDAKRMKLRNACDGCNCVVRELPRVNELIRQKSLLKQSKKLKLEDLLGREEIHFENKSVEDLINNSVCLITGGGGSIGSELCRQIVKFDPKKIIILDIYENNAYDIQQELKISSPNADISVEIASVRDYDKLNLLFNKYRPYVVFHAAAHKHVPLMEDNPEESVKNNIFGTYNVATLCDLYKVKKMVLISTDKAVNPTNVMGATKRFCEMIMQYMSQKGSSTEFTAVRFGNVLGSNGSVIPLFKRQIEAGGPVTVTHPDIIRYFMTIPEAVSLLLQAGSMAKGSEIFILDMGESIKITTLAENIIKFYGYEPYVEMPIVFTGLRPGEKLFEELLMDEEGLQSTLNEKIFIGNQIAIEPIKFSENIKELEIACKSNNSKKVVQCLHKAVPTYIVPERKVAYSPLQQEKCMEKSHQSVPAIK